MAEQAKLGQAQQQLQVGEDGDGVLPSITAYARSEARSRPIAAIALGPDPVTEPTARPSAASGSGSASYQSPPPRGPERCRAASWTPADAGQPGGEQFLGDGRHARARALDLDEPGQMLGGVPRVQPGEMALPLDRLRGLVVQPDGGAERAYRLGGQRERVARRVSEPGGDLAVAGIESVLGEQVGLGDLAVTARQPVEDAAVRQGTARHGLDVPEIGAAEAEADGRVRAESVARFQDE